MFFIVAGYGVVFFSDTISSTDLSYSSENYQSIEPAEKKFIATHIPTPEPLKAIYMTGWVAGSSKLRDGLVKLVNETELNAVVIDIKDYSGKLSYVSESPILAVADSSEERIIDIREFIQRLHDNNIYVIGRITVFQDPFYARKHPELAVKKESDKTLWADKKGINYIDPGSREFWDYIVEIARVARADGFDELNFDYIRFPSDGDMTDIYYPFSDARIVADAKWGKAVVLEEFFKYLNENLTSTGAVLSADLFGMTTTNPDDLNIGQVLERTMPYFDYIAPMVYPSHYPSSFIGLGNPNSDPYRVVNYSMVEAVRRARATTTFISALTHTLISTSTRPYTYKKDAYSPLVLRPWLQDFDYGGNYDVAEVKAQIQATYDAGLTSWMLWAPSNVYTRGALFPEKEGSTVVPLYE